MLKNEYEIITYPRIKHLNMFLVRVTYRNFHVHHEFELCLVLDGQAIVRLNDSEFKISRGSVVLFNSNQAHEILADGAPVLLLSIQVSNHFSREYFPRLRNIEFDTTDLCSVLSSEQSDRLVSRLCSTATEYLQMAPAYELQCVAQICSLFHNLLTWIPWREIDEAAYSARKKRALRMNRIASFIESHYVDRITLENIAREENISATHLSHIFRENFGITFQEYLNNIRFEKALQMITGSREGLLEISVESGFSDSKYMNKMFQKHFGCTPKEYRQNMSDTPALQAAVNNHAEKQKFFSDVESLQMIAEAIIWNEQRTTNSMERTTNDEQRTVWNEQRTTNNEQYGTNNERRFFILPIFATQLENFNSYMKKPEASLPQANSLFRGFLFLNC